MSLRLFAFPLFLAATGAAFAQGSDPIGLDALRAFDPTLTGSGIVVAQPEAPSYPNYLQGDFEVNPAAVGQPASKFIYTGTDGSTATGFPNSLGDNSLHGDTVGDYFYGDNNTSNPEGVAPGVSQIYNYPADYFVNTLIANAIFIPAKIVNQSFVATNDGGADQIGLDQEYDWYAAEYGTLFISGAGDGGAVYSPASCYNGIGVAADPGPTSVGPTYGGRSKPDITAPGGATSWSTPLVSGAATLLLQGAERGDAGPGTIIAASDARVLKVLLLNGAVKPSGWIHSDTAPLDPTYGAGILNVYNSYMNLRAGEYTSSASTSGSIGAVNSGATVPSEEGWNLATITTALVSGTFVSQSDHYLFDLSSATAPEFTLTSTLTWDMQYGQSAINNLDLYLFNATTGASIALSDSTVDNVQQLYVTGLSPGDYDLVVVKDGGLSISGSDGTVVSPSETYALAFDFASVPEPSNLLLLGLALLPALALVRRRR